MKNPRRIDSCLNCRHCETIDQWDWQEHNCLHDAEPMPYVSEEITDDELQAIWEWRENHGVDFGMICDAWEKMK